MCHQSTGWLKPEDKKLMSIGYARQIIDECARIGVYSMKVNWRGEPLLHSAVAALIRYMKAVGIHEVMMNTNGLLLTPALSRELIESGLDRIIFSCDGITKDVYEGIRRGGDFHRFMDNLYSFKRICDENRAYGEKVPKIRINCTVQKLNGAKRTEFKRFFKDITGDVRLNEIYNPQGEGKTKEFRKAKKRGCPQIYQRLVIGADGEVSPCCADYLGKLGLGHAGEAPLSEVYSSKEFGIRKMHESHRGRDLPGCDKCDLFSLSEKNDRGEIVWR